MKVLFLTFIKKRYHLDDSGRRAGEIWEALAEAQGKDLLDFSRWSK